MTEGQPFRVLPRVTDQTEAFWTGGAEGELRFLRCHDCGYYVHPPGPVCPVDLSRQLEWEAVSGRGVVHTYTVNHQPWYPGLDPPYLVAIVTLDEQDDLRLMTNLVGLEPEDAAVGMPVQVCFEQYDDVWLPFFEPRR